MECNLNKMFKTKKMGMMNSRDLNLTSVLQHELIPVPTALFDENGNMHITKTKSTLKNKLKVEKSNRNFRHQTSTSLIGVQSFGWSIGYHRVLWRIMLMVWLNMLSETQRYVPSL